VSGREGERKQILQSVHNQVQLMTWPHRQNSWGISRMKHAHSREIFLDINLCKYGDASRQGLPGRGAQVIPESRECVHQDDLLRSVHHVSRTAEDLLGGAQTIHVLVIRLAR
jgi:hypothetical protein